MLPTRSTLLARMTGMAVLAGLAGIILSAAVAAAEGNRTLSQSFPSKPIRVLVTVTPSLGLDVVTRAVTSAMSEGLRHPVIVDNVAGANGAIAVNQVLSSPPDGHLLLSTDGGVTLDAALGRFKRNLRTALLPVAEMGQQPYLLYAAATSPDHSLKDLVARARRQPGRLNYGSTGVGSIPHLGMALICATAGVDMVHIPYRGTGGSISDLASGRLDALIMTLPTALQFTKAGKIRPLAVATPDRTDSFRGLPTVAEAGFPGYALFNTYALYAPEGMPLTRLTALNQEVARVLTLEKTRTQLAAELVTPALPRPVEELRRLMIEDLHFWAAALRKTKLR